MHKFPVKKLTVHFALEVQTVHVCTAVLIEILMISLFGEFGILKSASVSS